MLALTIAAPLLAALLLVHRPARPVVARLAPIAAAPALALALRGPEGWVEVEWLLLGARVGMDATGRVFLLFTALIWMAATLYARTYMAADPQRHRFLGFLLLTMAGNLGLIVGGDMITFYLFFAVMSFASYGLIIHNADSGALQAGRVYLVLVIVGELLLFTGIMATAALAGSVDLLAAPPLVAVSPWGPIVVALLLAGFGIKVGALPLHVWLPLAHPAAPTPASAILSGAMIKAGLLGWLRFLPLGETALPVFGTLCLGAGVAAAFFGVLIGVTQTNPKTALAYSSISQMGFMTVGVGAGLVAPDAWPLLLPAVLLYATHHGLAKGALFLGVGLGSAVRSGGGGWRRSVVALLALPGVALAGVPLTTGAISKVSLKNALDAAVLPVGALDVWLAWAAVGTTALMARYVVLLSRPGLAVHTHPSPGLWVPWILLALAGPLLLWVAPLTMFQGAAVTSLAPQYAWSTIWPPLVGAALVWLAWTQPALAVWRARLHVPAGDLLWPLLRVTRPVFVLVRWQTRRPLLARIAVAPRAWIHREWLPQQIVVMERRLTGWLVIGTILLSVALGLGWLLT